jgi:hypothetical protein
MWRRSSTHLADLVDAVGELEPAVLHVDQGMDMRHVAAVDIGNAGHRMNQRFDGGAAFGGRPIFCRWVTGSRTGRRYTTDGIS